MSVFGAARLASIRDTGTAGAPVMNSDMGAAKQDPAKWQDTLAKLVPGETIAVYTALLTLYLGAIQKPTDEKPKPNQFVPGRIVMWAVFLVLTWLVAYVAYRKATPKDKRRAFPKEIVVAVSAFAAWGMSAPGSWLIELFDSTATRIILPAGIAGVAAVALGVIANTTTTNEP